MTPETRIDRLEESLKTAQETHLNRRETVIKLLQCMDACDIEEIIGTNEFDECRRIANAVQMGMMAEAARLKRQSASEPLRRLIQMQCDEIKRLKKEAGK